MYNVYFLINGVWCANIALGTEEQVREKYGRYGELILSPATAWELQDARERGKPVIDCRK